MITRRTALKSIGAGIITATTNSINAANKPASTDVIIIGAGLSGLYAATMLQELGATVQVVEASKRIGGRVHTIFDQSGYREMGALTLGSGYTRTINTAKKLGVELTDLTTRMTNSKPLQLVLGDQIIQAKQWESSSLNPFTGAKRKIMPWRLINSEMGDSNPLPTAADWLNPKFAHYDIPLQQYFTQLGLTDAEIKLAYDNSPYFGSSAIDVSALLHFFNNSWIKEQIKIGRSQYAVTGGNQKLPEAMAASLKNEVLLNKEVSEIDTSSKPVIRFKDGGTLTAKHVISSVPFSKLRDISITPKLESRQRTAVKSLNYMRVSRMYLRPRQPFWEKDGLSPSMWTNGLASAIYAQNFGADEKEITSLSVSVRGYGADRLDRLGAAAAGSAVIAEIEKVRPAAKGQLEFVGYHSWWLDPYAAGAYAVPAPGQVSAFLPDMSKPHGTLHFCGEHTAISQRGMEGAMESAERAVTELAAAL